MVLQVLVIKQSIGQDEFTGKTTLSQSISKIIKIHSKGDMEVPNKFLGNISNSCLDIFVWSKVMKEPTLMSKEEYSNNTATVKSILETKHRIIVSTQNYLEFLRKWVNHTKI